MLFRRNQPPGEGDERSKKLAHLTDLERTLAPVMRDARRELAEHRRQRLTAAIDDTARQLRSDGGRR